MSSDISQRPSYALTHPGPFHADDVLSGAILRLVFGGEFRILRSDVAEDMRIAPLVFDTGGVFDPHHGRFDHHQGGVGTHGCGTPFSSAGLLWREFGTRAVASVVPGLSESDVDRVAESVRGMAVLPVDAWDNGIFPEWRNPPALPFQVTVNATVQGGDADEGYELAVAFASRFLRGLIFQRVAAVERERDLAILANGGGVDGISVFRDGAGSVWMWSSRVPFVFREAALAFLDKGITLAGLVCPAPPGRAGAWNVTSSGILPPLEDACYRSADGKFAVLRSRDDVLSVLRRTTEPQPPA